MRKCTTKNFGLLLLLLLAGLCTQAQQQAQYSLYMMNNFTLNPAMAGTEDFIDLKASFRTQWVDFEGAPKNIYITGHSALKKQELEFDDVKPLPFHGIGGYMYSDNTGPTSKLAAYAAYAFHLPITRDLTVSFGTYVGFQQYRIDASQLQFHDGPTDNALDGLSTKFLPDAHVGTWIYSRNWYAGGALYQVFNNQLNFTEVGVVKGKLNQHYFATAGYRQPLTDDFTLVPSFVIKAVTPAPIQFDINAKLRYRHVAWAGISYRNKDAIVLIIGGTIMEKIDMGYSYDITTSNVRNYSAGSHELVIGYRVPTTDHGPPPAQFW